MSNQEPVLEYISAKDVKVRPIKWLWPFFIPKGKINSSLADISVLPSRSLCKKCRGFLNAPLDKSTEKLIVRYRL